MATTPTKSFTGTNSNELFSEVAGSVPVIIDGAGGNDVVWGDDGYDLNYGGLGNDLMSGGGASDTIYGDNYADLYQPGGNDFILGNFALVPGYNPSFQGLDLIFAGAGNDFANGEGGNDHIEGGPGNDRLWGGFHTDFITGGDGDDEMWGGARPSVPQISQ